MAISVKSTITTEKATIFGMAYPILGAHMSIAGGYYKAVELAKRSGCDCVQLFTKMRPDQILQGPTQFARAAGGICCGRGGPSCAAG